MTRTTTGILAAILPLAVIVLDRTLGLGLPAEVASLLWLAVLGGCGLGAHGLQRRLPRGSYAHRPVPTTRTERRRKAGEELLRSKERGE